ncbi:ATP-binding protein [Microbacterium barkeri]|uniref:ATP-binding protein n=1 Tax=Microbacterium barkeri TaxID=33917 RepID=A0A9W6H3R2_9MICO|nr:SbcC/MukB-like Walker B domain-containing protein [Microbacterium barkeri]MDI6943452.1 ATP-binding protein [Microbacterium barkeri]MDR6878156.1 uncharacterized protein YPO0396 [Microbacterium barkeri]GLJ61459.1 ATP-binding protein [Microbacterium barkeri]
MTMLDLPIAPSRPQWRLARIEVVNWGTFDGAHGIDVARKGHLFTGASGSGKSSLLDAVAAVMTPDRWLRFNAAAQDGSSRADDRSLVSYVRGAWSKEADEALDRAVSAYVRPRATWSGILLRYENEVDAPVTLVRLFHLPGSGTDRADLRDALLLLRDTVALVDFAPFAAKGIEARRLKAAYPDAYVSTGSHGGFYQRLRRSLGIGSDNALQLLHRTQAAKNLGSLDHLFRTFMLDRPSTFERADNATEQFGELSAAHQHVVQLRLQAEQLREISATIAAYERESRVAAELERLLAVREVFQDRFHLKITQDDHADLIAAKARAEDVAQRAARAREEADEQLRAAQLREAQLGGGDAQHLRARLDDARAAADATARRWSQLAAELSGVGLDTPPQSAADFAELQQAARSALDEERPAASRDHAANARFFEARRELEKIDAELEALRRRRSNIPADLQGVRAWLCAETGLTEQALPFGGELIEVLPEYEEWTGAIERVLRPIASSLLVRDEHLAAVRRLVEGRHLGARLVVEAVPLVAESPRPARAPQTLLHRIRVSDGPFGTWLSSRLATSYDISCVDGPDALDDVERGVTIGGQIKLSSRRYEKNDRVAIDDRRHWILGADNEAKVELLLVRRRDAERRMAEAAGLLDAVQREIEAAARRRATLERVLETEWSSIDREAAEAAVAARLRELAALTEGNGELADATRVAEEARALWHQRDEASRLADTELARAGDRLHDTERLIETLTARLDGRTIDEADARDLEARYRSIQRRIGRDDIERVGQRVTSAMHHEATAAGARRAEAQSSFQEQAGAFRARWESAAADLTSSIEDRDGYRALLATIESRGLPEHESNFQRLLRERSRDLIGHLLSDIRDAPKQIAERIDPVNSSLGRSLFDTDRFLRIVVKVRRGPEVVEFMSDLKSIVDGAWADDDLDRAEQRFAVLERIMRRLASDDSADRGWRQRCLDTREHVSFTAHEVDRAGRVVGVHDSSAGLSGGQRQKLVIFCLAAALRYQLTTDDEDVPTYATIVLDEAFDKADSRYTRMAMDVFTEFGFHMILATPHKLLQTIERYVGAVTSVSNPSRQQSVLANVAFTERR